jgi:hypothetical protein
MLSVGGLSWTVSARGETLVESNVDYRITVALRVGQAAAQDWLPAPWQVRPVAAGPFKEANLFVVFADRFLNQDADGKVVAGGTFRTVALAIPAKHPETGESAPFVIRVYGPHEGPGPYKNSLQATVRRQATLQGEDLEPGTGNEAWEVREGAGGTLTLRMGYQRAVPSRSQQELRPRSAVDPSFFRIYRYDQGVDVVKSVAAGTDRVSDYQLRVNVPDLEGLFDGTEQLVGVAVVPWYVRQIFLP